MIAGGVWTPDGSRTGSTPAGSTIRDPPICTTVTRTPARVEPRCTHAGNPTEGDEAGPASSPGIQPASNVLLVHASCASPSPPPSGTCWTSDGPPPLPSGSPVISAPSGVHWPDFQDRHPAEERARHEALPGHGGHRGNPHRRALGRAGRRDHQPDALRQGRRLLRGHPQGDLQADLGPGERRGRRRGRRGHAHRRAARLPASRRTSWSRCR